MSRCAGCCGEGVRKANRGAEAVREQSRPVLSPPASFPGCVVLSEVDIKCVPWVELGLWPISVRAFLANIRPSKDWSAWPPMEVACTQITSRPSGPTTVRFAMRQTGTAHACTRGKCERVAHSHAVQHSGRHTQASGALRGPSSRPSSGPARRQRAPWRWSPIARRSRAAPQFWTGSVGTHPWQEHWATCGAGMCAARRSLFGSPATNQARTRLGASVLGNCWGTSSPTPRRPRRGGGSPRRHRQ